MVWFVSRVVLGFIGRNIPQQSFSLTRTCLPCSSARSFASVDQTLPSLDNEEPVDLETLEREKAAAEMEAKRNKSRLRGRHFKLVHNQIPVDLNDPEFSYEQTVKFRRKMAARFGENAGVNLGIAWPTKKQLDEMIDYERVAHPLTIQELVANKKKQREEERQRIIDRYAIVYFITNKQ